MKRIFFLLLLLTIFTFKESLADKAECSLSSSEIDTLKDLNESSSILIQAEKMIADLDYFSKYKSGDPKPKEFEELKKNNAVLETLLDVKEIMKELKTFAEDEKYLPKLRSVAYYRYSKLNKIAMKLDFTISFPFTLNLIKAAGYKKKGNRKLLAYGLDGIDALKKAISLDSNNTEAVSSLARFIEFASKNKDARKILEKPLKKKFNILLSS